MWDSRKDGRGWGPGEVGAAGGGVGDHSAESPIKLSFFVMFLVERGGNRSVSGR